MSVDAILDRLEALDSAATPAPWEVETDFYECGGDYPCGHGYFPYLLLAPARQVERWGVTGPARLANFVEEGDTTEADAALISAARNALPALLRIARAALTLRRAKTANDAAAAWEELRSALDSLGEEAG